MVQTNENALSEHTRCDIAETNYLNKMIDKVQSQTPKHERLKFHKMLLPIHV